MTLAPQFVPSPVLQVVARAQVSVAPSVAPHLHGSWLLFIPSVLVQLASGTEQSLLPSLERT